MSPETIHHTVRVLLGVATAGAVMSGNPALIAGAGALAAGKTYLETWISGTALLAPNNKAMAEQLEAELVRSLTSILDGASHEFGGSDAPTLALQMVEVAVPSHSDIVAANLDPTILLAAMIRKLDGNPDFRDPATQHLFKEIVLAVFTRSLAAPDFIAKLEPLIFANLLAGQDRIEGKVDGIAAAVASIDSKLAFNPRERDDLLQTIAKLKSEKAATESLIQAFLVVVTGREVPADQFTATLFTMVQNWHEAGKQIGSLEFSRNLTPELDILRLQARDAFDAEQIEEVWSLQTLIEDIEERALNDLILQRKDVENEESTRRKDLIRTKRTKILLAIALVQPAEAATLIGDIAKLVSVTRSEQFNFVRAEWKESFQRGRRTTVQIYLDVALEVSIQGLQIANDGNSRGLAYADMGFTKLILAERRPDSNLLSDAIELLKRGLGQAGLEGATEAELHYRLGNGLRLLGERTDNVDTLRESVANFNTAIEFRASQNNTEALALAYSNRANPLSLIAKICNERQSFDAALSDYDRAIEMLKVGGDEPVWGNTQHNRASMLCSSGVVFKDGWRLLESIRGFNLALQERTFEKFPSYWAISKANQSRAYAALGKLRKSMRFLEASQCVLEEAKTVHTKRDRPFLYARDRSDLAELYVAKFSLDNLYLNLVDAERNCLEAQQIYIESGNAKYVNEIAAQLSAIQSKQNNTAG